MGGCSAINYMLYVRGTRHDFGQWESDGNYGWDWETVLHYYKKSEDNQNPYIARNSKLKYTAFWFLRHCNVITFFLELLKYYIIISVLYYISHKTFFQIKVPKLH